MSKKAFDKIMGGLNDAITFSESQRDGYGVHVLDPLDIKAIRAKTGLSQAKFASAFALEKRAVEDWEQGRRAPHGAARVLLKVIDREPQAVMRALAA